MDQGVELTIEQYSTPALISGVLCTVAIVAVSMYLVNQFGGAMWAITPFCVLLLLFTMSIAIRARLRRTLTLTPSELTLRSSWFGLSRTRRFDRAETSLGYMGPSHGSSASLALGYRDNRVQKWINLASRVDEEQVRAMLEDIRARGFLVPE